MNACAGPSKNAFFTRVLLLAVVMTPVACTRDDTAVDSREQSVAPEPARPVAAPEWYPTPKRAGRPSFRINTPVAGGAGSGSRQSASRAADNQPRVYEAPATPAQPWSSAQDQARRQDDSSWYSQQPSDRVGETPEQQRAYRPWGAYNKGATPSQAKPQSPNVWQFPNPQPAWNGDSTRQGYPPGPAFGNGVPQYAW